MSHMLLDELAEKINKKLSNSPQLASYALKARIYDDGTVQVQGIVDVLEEKIQAEEMIWGFPGVKKVENDITVCTDGEIDDNDVAFEVSEELRANPEIPPSIGVKVSGGEVQLMGSVNSLGEAREAIETAAKARGVRGVQSRLKVNDDLDDASINNLVQTVLLEEPGLIPGRVKTITNNGVVTLLGKVPENQAALAIETIAKVPGVKKVKNLMNQKPVEPDDKIVIYFMEEIVANPYLNQAPIGIEVSDGKISISGEIDGIKAKKDIEDIIHRVVERFKQVIYKVDNKLRLSTD